MARLNEAPAPPPESHLDLLRKRFLKQNREIARQNSNQGLKIRQLEFELQRLLTENLDQRSQIYRLETEVQDSKARRVADHAMEIKAKVEAQLAGISDLLNTLGTEPPTKRRMSRDSRGSRTIVRPRPSTTPPNSSARPVQKSREDRKDAEDAAEIQGRLPPIFETKTYPRRSMNADEILALCAEAAEEDEIVEEEVDSSAEIGPAPTLQFLENVEEPIKTDSPYQPSPPSLPGNTTLDMGASRKLFPSPPPKRESRSKSKSTPVIAPSATISEAPSPVKVDRKPLAELKVGVAKKSTEETLVSRKSDIFPPPPVLEAKPMNSTTTEAAPTITAAVSAPTAAPSAKISTSAPVTHKTKSTAPVAPELAPAPAKGKRKLSAREDDQQASAPARTTKTLSDRSSTTIDLNGRKPIKSLSSVKNRSEKSRASSAPISPAPQRKVLGVKSSNSDVASPLKRSASAGGKGWGTGKQVFDEISAAKVEAMKAAATRASAREDVPQRGSGAVATSGVGKEQVKKRGRGGAKDKAGGGDEIVPARVAPPPPAAAKVATLEVQPTMEPSPERLSHVRNRHASPMPPTPRQAGDTPSPGTDVAGGEPEPARPSRRARTSVVNYAEPSLVRKMRRPSKAMVDAVVGEGKQSRTSVGAVAPPVQLEKESLTPLASTARNKKGGRENDHAEEDQIVDLPSMKMQTVFPVEPDMQCVDPYDFAPSSPAGEGDEHLHHHGDNGFEGKHVSDGDGGDSSSSAQLREEERALPGIEVRLRQGKPRRGNRGKVVDYECGGEDDVFALDESGDFVPSGTGKSAGGGSGRAGGGGSGRGGARKRASVAVGHADNGDGYGNGGDWDDYDYSGSTVEDESSGFVPQGQQQGGRGRRRSMMV